MCKTFTINNNNIIIINIYNFIIIEMQLSICFDEFVLLSSRLRYSHINFLLKHSLHVLYMLPSLYEKQCTTIVAQ